MVSEAMADARLLRAYLRHRMEELSTVILTAGSWPPPPGVAVDELGVYDRQDGQLIGHRHVYVNRASPWLVLCFYYGEWMVMHRETAHRQRLRVACDTLLPPITTSATWQQWSRPDGGRTVWIDKPTISCIIGDSERVSQTLHAMAEWRAEQLKLGSAAVVLVPPDLVLTLARPTIFMDAFGVYLRREEKACGRHTYGIAASISSRTVERDTYILRYDGWTWLVECHNGNGSQLCYNFFDDCMVPEMIQMAKISNRMLSYPDALTAFLQKGSSTFALERLLRAREQCRDLEGSLVPVPAATLDVARACLAARQTALTELRHVTRGWPVYTSTAGPLPTLEALNALDNALAAAHESGLSPGRFPTYTTLLCRMLDFVHTTLGKVFHVGAADLCAMSDALSLCNNLTIVSPTALPRPWPPKLDVVLAARARLGMHTLKHTPAVQFAAPTSLSWRTQCFSDCQLVLNHHTYDVHKAILAMGSECFRGMLTFPSTRHDHVCNLDGLLADLRGHDGFAAAFEVTLDFVYRITTPYDDGAFFIMKAPNSPDQCALLWQLADFLCVHQMQSSLLTFLTTRCQNAWRVELACSEGKDRAKTVFCAHLLRAAFALHSDDLVCFCLSQLGVPRNSDLDGLFQALDAGRTSCFVYSLQTGHAHHSSDCTPAKRGRESDMVTLSDMESEFDSPE
jgi:hypothetical protein